MPSFCQVMVGLGEPVALQGKVMGLLKITSRVDGCDWITGSSEDREKKREHAVILLYFCVLLLYTDSRPFYQFTVLLLL